MKSKVQSLKSKVHRPRTRTGLYGCVKHSVKSDVGKPPVKWKVASITG